MSTYILTVAVGESLLEVVMDNEEKDLWNAFLQRGDYAMAARYANSQVLSNTELMIKELH